MITTALGVAAGIVLAVLILYFWPVILAGSAMLIVFGILLAILLAGGVYLSAHGVFVGNAILFSVIALPFVLFGWKGWEIYCLKYPKVPKFIAAHETIASWCMGIFCLVMFFTVLMIYGYFTS